MSLKISYILPCYNVEHYIVDCLDSIYTQDMPEYEYEVICVNDCSTDMTRSIICEYRNKHSNLVLIDHKQNLTVGGARNTGLEIAKGEYVWFVDPDDVLKKGVAEIVYEKAAVNKLDLIMFNFEVVDEKLQLIETNLMFVDTGVMSGQNYIDAFFQNCLSELCIVWRNLFRKEFLSNNKLCFPRMPKGEDVSFLWKVILVAERVASVSDSYYIYRKNPYSVANKNFDAVVLFSERILFGNEIKLLLDNKDLKISDPIRNEMERALRWCVNSNFELLQMMSDKEKNKYYEEIVSNKTVVNSLRHYMNRKHKCVFFTFGGKRFWLFKLKALNII